PRGGGAAADSGRCGTPRQPGAAGVARSASRFDSEAGRPKGNSAEMNAKSATMMKDAKSQAKLDAKPHASAASAAATIAHYHRRTTCRICKSPKIHTFLDF